MRIDVNAVVLPLTFSFDTEMNFSWNWKSWSSKYKHIAVDYHIICL